jgi:hypothetical protein
MISDIMYILFGVAVVIAVFAFEMEPYYALLGVGFVLWGAYEIYKEVRDLNREGEVSQLAKEREEIRNKLDKGN